MKDNNKRKKKIKTGLVAGITTASVLVGSAFDSPDDFLHQHTNIKVASEDVDIYGAQNQINDNHNDTVKNKFKQLIYKIPIKIRTYLFVPLWFIGNLLITLFDFLFQTLISPFGKVIGNTLLNIIILFSIVIICLKLLFPDMPLRKTFNKRTIIFVFTGSIIMGLCDYFMPFYFDKYEYYKRITEFIFGLLMLFIILKPYIKKRLKKQYKYQIEYEVQ